MSILLPGKHLGNGISFKIILGDPLVALNLRFRNMLNLILILVPTPGEGKIDENS